MVDRHLANLEKRNYAAIAKDLGLELDLQLGVGLRRLENVRGDPAALAAAGLVPGPWLRELKGRWRRGELGQAPLTVAWAQVSMRASARTAKRSGNSTGCPGVPPCRA